MELEYIHAKYLGWASPRSTSVSMSGYLGPAATDIKDLGRYYSKGEITHCYRLEIQPNGECWVPDLTANRKKLKKRVERQLFKIVTPNVDLDAPSPCDALIRVSKVEQEKEKLLSEIQELKSQIGNRQDGNGVVVTQEEVVDSAPKAAPKKRRGRKPKAKVEETPEIPEDLIPDME